MNVSRLCLLIFTGLGVCGVEASESVLPTYVSRMLDRPSRIATGLLHFKVENYILTSSGMRESTIVQEFTLTKDGEEWIMRYANSPNKAMSRKDYSAIYYEAGGTGKSKSLALAGSIGPISTKAGDEVWKCCGFVGSVLTPSVRQHVQQNWKDATLSTSRFNGVECIVAEFTIKKADLFTVLTSVHPSLLESEASTLRLYLTDDAKAALLKYEIVGPQGVVELMTAEEFYDVGDNLFMPKRWARSVGLGDRKIVTEVELVNAEYVNKPLPKDAFEFVVPKGTRVTDNRRAGAGRRFKIDEDHPVSSIDDAVRSDLTKNFKPIPALPTPRKGPSLWLINLTILAVLVITWIFGKRLKRT